MFPPAAVLASLRSAVVFLGIREGSNVLASLSYTELVVRCGMLSRWCLDRAGRYHHPDRGRCWSVAPPHWRRAQ